LCGKMSEIVITGIGVISSLGVGREAFWSGCREARSGIKRVSIPEADSMGCNVAGWIDDFDPRRFLSPRVYRRMSRVSRMAVAASCEALEDSGVPLDSGRDRIAVILGTAYGSSSHVEDFYMSLLEGGPRGAQPFLFPETVPNAPASHVAIVNGITGPNTTFSQNEISAECAILFGADLLRHHRADVVLAGGAEELSEMLFFCYQAVGALWKFKTEKEGPVPFEPGGGIVLGEGAAVLVMERGEDALARGARIYGRLRSCVIRGGEADLGHYETKGTRMARAMEEALDAAAMGTGDIDRIHVSANGTGELDRMEHDRIKEMFDRGGEDLEVTPLKYLLGDFGAAGALRAAAALLSLYHRQPLPTVRIGTLLGDPHVPVWTFHPPGRSTGILMTTSTFGGGSATLVFTEASGAGSP